MRKFTAGRQFIINILFIIMLATLMAGLILLGNKSANAYADSCVNENTQQLNQKYDDDSILVVLDEKISGVNKVHNKNF